MNNPKRKWNMLFQRGSPNHPPGKLHIESRAFNLMKNQVGRPAFFVSTHSEQKTILPQNRSGNDKHLFRDNRGNAWKDLINNSVYFSDPRKFQLNRDQKWRGSTAPPPDSMIRILLRPCCQADGGSHGSSTMLCPYYTVDTLRKQPKTQKP